MSDARTEAIHKAATELVQELLNASGEDGGERWFRIIVRKMERVMEEAAMAGIQSSARIRIANTELTRLHNKIIVDQVWRGDAVSPGGDCVYEADIWEPKDIAKLKLWLNGQ